MADLIEQTEQKVNQMTTQEEAIQMLGLKAGTFKLIKPLLVNGVERTELNYDFEEIDYITFKQAGSLASSVPGVTMDGNVKQMENDYNYHLYMGFAAIVAVNKDITIRDLERLKGIDLNIIQESGRNFTMAYLVGRVQSNVSANNSEQPTEDIANDTTAQSSNSKK